MTKLSIWNNRREKDTTDFEWAKELINEILDGQIQKEKELLNRETKVKSLSDLEVMTITEIERPQFKHFPGGYESDYQTEAQIEARCAQAMKDVDRILTLATEQHEKNLPAIKNNKLIVEGLNQMMEKFGVKSSYTEWGYKTPRHRTKDTNRIFNKDTITKYCSWPSEISRFIKTSDSFGNIENQCNARRKEIENWKVKKLQELTDKQKLEQQNAEKLVETRLLAQMQLKYNLKPEEDWGDALCAIISKNKYLNLAYWLERNRGDWNDGYHYAECGLEDFEVETEIDQLIYDDIQSEIDNWDGDGRCFRDCVYNYSVLYGMVNDEELMKDYETAKRYER